MVCYDQIIYDDERVEPLEYLGLKLAVLDSSVRTQVDPATCDAAIAIVDQDGEQYCTAHATCV